jgi:hypothetical protein
MRAARKSGPRLMSPWAAALAELMLMLKP